MWKLFRYCSYKICKLKHAAFIVYNVEGLCKTVCEFHLLSCALNGSSFWAERCFSVSCKVPLSWCVCKEIRWLVEFFLFIMCLLKILHQWIRKVVIYCTSKLCIVHQYKLVWILVETSDVQWMPLCSCDMFKRANKPDMLTSRLLFL